VISGWRSVLRPIACLALLSTFSGACGKILGVDEYRVAGGGPATRTDGSAGLIQYADATCRQCVAKSCVAEQSDCEHDATCTTFASCLLGCDKTNGHCLYDCEQDLKEVNQTASRLMACSFHDCPGQCFSCGAVYSGITRECAKCAIEDTASGGLCDLTTQCLFDPACNGFLSCLAGLCKKFGAPDPECRLVCGSKYPSEARAFYRGVGTRFQLGCQNQCLGSQAWDCIQPTVWPPKSGPRAKLTLHTPPSGADASLSSIRVRACKGADIVCADPVGDENTDLSGAVTFDVDQAEGMAGAYYFELYEPGAAAPFLIYDPLQPIVGDITLWVPDATWSNVAPLDAIVASQGGSRDTTTRGTVVAMIATCIGAYADLLVASPQITMSASSGDPPYYELPPNTSATGGGVASFANVPAPSTSIVVRRLGTKIAGAVVPVRAGVLTFISFNYPQFL